AVAAAATSRVALLIAEVLAQFGAERPFEQSSFQFSEQPILAEQILRRVIPLQQLLHQLVSDRLGYIPCSSLLHRASHGSNLHKIPDNFALVADRRPRRARWGGDRGG